MNQKTAIYYVERCLKDNGAVIDSGIHEIYANLTCKCGNVVKKVQFYKEKKEGIEIMCRILDAERTKGIEEGIEVGMKEGMKEGLKANRINVLNRRLLSDDRKEDIMKSLVNSEYQAVLLREYEL